MRIKSVSKLVYSVIICQVAGLVGGLFTSSSVSTWYAELNKPAFNPPSWVFSPVWITLYLLMGVSLYLVWVSEKKESKAALYVFGVQLALNVIWSVIFFGLRAPFYAFIWIVILWAAILLMIVKFYRVSGWAAYLQLPYLLWVTFAAVLNFSLFYLN
jgi:tryptophan-rich sensory protein